MESVSPDPKFEEIPKSIITDWIPTAFHQQFAEDIAKKKFVFLKDGIEQNKGGFDYTVHFKRGEIKDKIGEVIGAKHDAGISYVQLCMFPNKMKMYNLTVEELPKLLHFPIVVSL